MSVHATLRRAAPRALILATLVLVACGSDGADTATRPDSDPSDASVPVTPAGAQPTADTTPDADALEDVESITLVTYDSFPESDTTLNDALAEFTDDTGIEVDLLVAGDTGTMLSKAALTVGNPEGDVMWGVDNTFLSRAIAAGVFDPYTSVRSDTIRPELLELVPDGEATPVNFGDVCVNYDIAWFDDNGLDVPASLDDLADPQYEGLLAVQNPATSSPGLAFLLATIDEYGEGWEDYWERLADNGVQVLDGWTDAYYGNFTWAGGGEQPLVVSYGSSPPAEVIFADPPRDDAPTGVIESTCFRQVEFAGVLAGTSAPRAARALVDHLVSDAVQSELALNLFVSPATTTVTLPEVFVEFAVVPAESRSVDPAEIDANRSEWIDTWTDIVLG